jgi:hypothetical protein
MEVPMESADPNFYFLRDSDGSRRVLEVRGTCRTYHTPSRARVTAHHVTLSSVSNSYVCVYVCAHLCVRAHTHTLTHVHMHICTYMYICNAFVGMYFIRIHTYTDHDMCIFHVILDINSRLFHKLTFVSFICFAIT